MKNVNPRRLDDLFGKGAAHRIKQDELGDGTPIAQWDIKRDPNDRLWLQNKRNLGGPLIDTGLTIPKG